MDRGPPPVLLGVVLGGIDAGIRDLTGPQLARTRDWIDVEARRMNRTSAGKVSLRI